MKTVRNVVRKIRIIAARLHSRRVGLLAFGLVIGILVVACGGGSTPPDQSNAQAASQAEVPATEASQAEVSATQESEASEPDTEESGADEPGTEEFGLTEEELVEKVEAVEALIATCMSDAGFEYVPVDYDTVRQAMEAVQNPPGLTEADFRAQFGYEISMQRAAADTPATIGLGEQNLQIFNSLSEADQIAYNRTLFGENTEETFAVALDAEDFTDTGGCTRAAIEQSFDPEELEELYRNPKDALIEQDPRMIAAIADWSDCMREAGFDYDNPEEIESDLDGRLEAVLDGADPETLSPDAQAALTELQGEERAIAIADYDCEVKFIVPAEQQIETELFGAPQN